MSINEIPVDEMKEKVAQLAKENFRIGLNCSESVFKALMDAGLFDFPAETVAIATGFGGGIGVSGGVCGALVGMTMGVSAVHGRLLTGAEEQSEVIDQLYGNPGRYRFFNQLPHAFEEKFGTLNCKELNKDFDSWFNKDRFRMCMKIVIESAQMAVDFIYQGKQEGYTQPFGQNMAGKV